MEDFSEVKTLWAKLVASKPVEADAVLDVEKIANESSRQLRGQVFSGTL